MSKIDYHALREASEKATKGKWAVEFDDEIYSTDGINHEQIAMVFSENESRDAEFIAAANPATVLALLDELDKWQQESSAWQAVAEKQLALAADAEKRIAELEERKVVQDEMTPKQASRSYCGEVRGYRDGWNDCRAAMLQGAEPVTDNTNQQFESLSRGDK